MSPYPPPAASLRSRRKFSWIFGGSPLGFFSLGSFCPRHFRLRLRMRRYSNPRKPKLPPFDRSTFRLFSSLISTLSFAISSRSRFSTAPIRPLMPRVGVNQYHQVIRKSRVLNIGVFRSSRGRNRLFQHTIYLGVCPRIPLRSVELA